MSSKTALITGVLGQDGSYLYEFLVDKGYEVYGIAKKNLSSNSEKILQYLELKGYKPRIIKCDLYSFNDVIKTVEKIRPDEVYHLAATHYPSQTSRTGDNVDRKLFMDNVSSTYNLLSSLSKVAPEARCVLAGSCLMFDDVDESPQSESTSFRTKSMYGLAKITENNIGQYFRDKGMHISMAIFYNHESPRRAENFVTKKIVKNMVSVKLGKIRNFELGDLDAVKDWGYAKDYVRGLYLMSSQPTPRDYIFATGRGHTVKDFVEVASNVLNIPDWQKHVRVNSEIISRRITAKLIGEPRLAEKHLAWRRTIEFHGLVQLMVENELQGKMD